MKRLGPSHHDPKPAETPRWVKTARWLWHEDDARPRDRERIEGAWKRIFGEPLPSHYAKNPDGTFIYVDDAIIPSQEWEAMWAATFDGGDSLYWLTHDGRIYSVSFEGGAIGLVTGPRGLVK